MVNGIEFVKKTIWEVYLDNARKSVGEIRMQVVRDVNMYRYFPNGGKTAGKSFTSLQACKNSIMCD